MKSLFSIKHILKEYAKKINAKCPYCNKKYNEKIFHTIDHIVPKIYGGTTEIANILVCCDICNNKRKRDLSLEVFVSRKPKIKKYLQRYLIKFQNLMINGKIYIDEISWIEPIIK